MKVVTYNVHTWEGQDGHLNVERLAEVIAGSGASVVSLNEVLHPVYTRYGQREVLVELADRLGMDWAFGESNRLVQRPSWWGPVGNAVLSRYPIVANRNHRLPKLPLTQDRNLLVARIQMGHGRNLTVYSTHLDHAFEGTRLWQLRGIVDKLRMHAQEAHLLMGDFNTHSPRDVDHHFLTPPVVRMLRNMGYVDAFARAGSGSPVTLKFRLPFLRIDYIFVPDQFSDRLTACYTLRDGGAEVVSDHLPLVAEFDWRL